MTAISEITHQHLGEPQLLTAEKRLLGPSRNPLQVLGQFKGTFSHNNIVLQQQVFVVKELKTNLLGLPAITALNLAARLDSTTSSDLHIHIHERFLKLFKGLGNLGEEFHIKLKPDAKPHALFTPRHVALPLRAKVEQELTRMEAIGVIAEVDEPTSWCAGMVVVPKKSGSIRICVDLKPLNESVLREVHPLPKVDETLAQLPGAQVFSKLDANSGFWQIPLAKESRLLTTFITPTGRYCFNKLPFVKACHHCAKHKTPRREPLIPSVLPAYPWQRISTDLFVLNGHTYMVVVDYFSRFPEVSKLTSTTSQSIISVLKTLFSRFGIPGEVVSDNGPQYGSQEFADFAKTYDFKHTTSSPHFPQSNGHAERAVQTVKKLLKGTTDPHLALLSYRSTPLPWCGISPAELLMGRQIRSNLPQPEDTLIPMWPYLTFNASEAVFKQQQKENFDIRHRTKPLPDIPPQTDVWITTNRDHSPGTVTATTDAPRSYVVEMPSGTVRRNRAQLSVMPEAQPSTTTTDLSLTQVRSPILTRSRSGI